MPTGAAMPNVEHVCVKKACKAKNVVVSTPSHLWRYLLLSVCRQISCSRFVNTA